ncbi:LacI family transcriptional regulator [Microlunatus elymi]|uniref:LacI family transcriptional regulator n=1 Tax=Microlunatus elymi TaxID=2596828 RepID=A0A516PXF6_9ACTN|nr:LacI family DNA-binding transcriptional regulator [Microlunatus elymi]QDP95857.1 LacI family transcriptional regulator [Microlunatus elymi]
MVERSTAVSIRDVAERAGVALGTVSNVLNRPQKVAEPTRKRVLDAIDELGFVRNDAARQLRAGLSRTLGLIVLDVANPFFTDVSRGVEDRAAEEGLSVLLGNSDESESRESAHLDLFEQQRVRGLLISPLGDVSARLGRLRRRGTPIVLVDRPAGDNPYSSVWVDDVAGGRMATEHLLQTGRRRIAFVGGPATIRQVADRRIGAEQAVGGSGAALEIIETDGLIVETGRKIGHELVARRPQDRPDAIFAANDMVAIGLMQSLALLEHRLVPDEIAMIGYDDIDFAAASVIPLSSIRQPSELIGRTAVELMLRELDAIESGVEVDHEQVVFQPELVIRASTDASAESADTAR